VFFTVLQSQNVSSGVVGAGAITVAGPTLVAAGVHAPPPVLGSGGIVIGGPAAAGSGTHAAPGHAGTGAVAIGGPLVAGAGTHSAPSGGSGAVAIGGPLISASGLCQAPQVAGALGDPRDVDSARPELSSSPRPAGRSGSRVTSNSSTRPVLTGGRRR
jgi:hypothetical protein